MGPGLLGYEQLLLAAPARTRFLVLSDMQTLEIDLKRVSCTVVLLLIGMSSRSKLWPGT
jgi:hypothetical protein